ncbi:hypothetical protein BJV82DRAFT_627496 [Fennellomyces sp. T-0311]|nr:hypothetical protein BJV82DRAFT_627496 [Fennellomyces sp. T-0311]
MDSFQFKFYSPLTPPDHRVGVAFDTLETSRVEWSLTPGIEDPYQDEILYSTDKPQQTGTDWLLSQYLSVSASTSSPGLPYQLDLVGELLFAVQPEPEYALPTDGMFTQANNDALVDHHRTVHEFHCTPTTSTLPAFPHDQRATTSDYCSTPIVKSQEKHAYLSKRPTASQPSSEPKVTASSPCKSRNPTMSNTKRRLTKKLQGCTGNDTNKSRYKCRLCDKTFSRSADRRRHEKRTVKHGAIKRYPCDICKIAVLSRQSDVARHKEKCIVRMQNIHSHI